MDKGQTSAGENPPVRASSISESAARLTTSELERIRNLAYLIELDGSSTVHIRGYAAEIDQAAADLITKGSFDGKTD